MIRLDISNAVSLYLILSVVLILVAWVFIERRPHERLDIGDALIWQCSICTFTYVDSRHDNISRCPRCGSLSKHGEERGS